MRLIGKIVKGIIFGTGACIWAKVIYDAYIKEPEIEPIVRPIMFM